MNHKLAISPLLIAVMLSGCGTMLGETFFAHYRLSEGTVAHIAKGNAVVNICLANNAIDKNVAYAYSNVTSQLLEISVLDRGYYKQSYQQSFDEYSAALPSYGVRKGCSELENGLPAVTQDYANTFMRVSAQLSAMRAQERQQMATMLNSFRGNMNSQSYAATYGWPAVNYVEAQPASTNYLVNTSKGLVQCRTTSKNYVFCM